jgi:hypothetical protein
MAEKKKDNKKKKPHHSGGEMGLGTIVLLVLVGVFILWILTGGDKKSTPKSPYMKSPIQNLPKTN